jgi:multimeric flavodoxin WrbA
MFRRNGFLLRDKVGGVIAVGGVRNGGQELTIQMVQAAMLVQDMIVVSEGKPTSHYGATLWSGHPDGIEKDTFGLETARNLGKRVAEVAAKMHK